MAAFPTATYRLQLTHRFGFADAESLVPYLSELGISDLYCSPILTARTGSEHCYDVTDPTQINPQLGGPAAFDALSRRLRDHGMGLLLDIVPNHMAVSHENRAFTNVLEYGLASPFADWFDIEWHAEPAETKRGAVHTGVLLPIMGKELDAAIADGEVSLQLEGGRFVVRYFDWTFPVNVNSIALILERVRVKVPTGGMGERHDAETKQMDELVGRIEQLPPWQEASGAAYRQACDDAKRQLAATLEHNANLQRGIEEAMAGINAAPDVLRELLDQQVYRLRHWRTAAKELSYRRFFDITDLIGVRVEHPRVFQQTHKLILRLLQMGRITGLRIDHIDGLADPAAYLGALENAAAHSLRDVGCGQAARRAYVLVEKILEADETLDETWPVSGTTGYEFLNAVNEVFVDGYGLESLGEHHARLTGVHKLFTEVVRRQKARVANDLFGSEVNALLRELKLAIGNESSPRVSESNLREALIALSVQLPVYRIYASAGEFPQRDRDLLSRTFSQLDQAPGINVLRHLLLDELPTRTDGQRNARQRFIIRWQQFTGPLMAKGLEDTSLYQDARLISLNEVGMDPRSLDGQPRGIDDFHTYMQARAARWPHAMNTTSTHDTKRGEDARARINVLSEMPQQWIDTATRWMTLNEPWKTASHQRLEQVIPDQRTELFLYQSALGMWPLAPQEQESAVDRLEKYAQKAAREAKLHTSWLEPDEAYEAALSHFVRGVFDPLRQDEFAASFRDLHRSVAWYGAMSSLSQALIKFAAPGVPDLYQGCELWDLSLVDPDNRRTVDFDLRRSILGDVANQLPSALLEHWGDGRIKFFLTHRALQARKHHTDLFLHGRYVPLRTGGEHAGRMLAFAREHQGRWAIAAAPIMYTRLAAVDQPPIGETIWRETVLHLPPGAPSTWCDCLTDRRLNAQRGSGGDFQLSAGEVFHDFPVALLVSH